MRVDLISCRLKVQNYSVNGSENLKRLSALCLEELAELRLQLYFLTKLMLSDLNEVAVVEDHQACPRGRIWYTWVGTRMPI